MHDKTMKKQIVIIQGDEAYLLDEYDEYDEQQELAEYEASYDVPENERIRHAR